MDLEYLGKSSYLTLFVVLTDPEAAPVPNAEVAGKASTFVVLTDPKDFGIGIITALIRIEGHPFGLMANNPHHLAGAIDSDGADKGARFLQLCDAFDLPVVSLMDCPGIMVGPEVEATALVRHSARLFNTGAKPFRSPVRISPPERLWVRGPGDVWRKLISSILHSGMANRGICWDEY